MRNLLEIKEWIKRFYSKYEVFIVPVLKFLLAFAALLGINGRLGYMTRIDNIAIVLIVALLCSFLPAGLTVFFSAVFILLHFYALALEVAVVGASLFLIMFLMFFRFSPKDTAVVVLTPLCFGLRIPYVIPIAMGLVGTPASAVSVGCGVIVYYLIHFVSASAASINTLEAEEVTGRLRIVIDGILGSREMMVMIVAFAFTVILVYAIRRMSIDHSWTIAMVAGTLINVVILLLGDLLYDTNISVVGLLLGSLVSLGLTAILQFFVFSVDYSRTEKVQFEDDEYYYYVKAVPKMTLAAPERTVKRINTQVGHSPQHPVRSSAAHGGQRAAGGPRNAGRQAPSRTITTAPGRTNGGSRNAGDEYDDFEEL